MATTQELTTATNAMNDSATALQGAQTVFENSANEIAAQKAAATAHQVAETAKVDDKIVDMTNSISNPNLLDNPDFKINQRGVVDGVVVNSTLPFDRWRIYGGVANLLTAADGTRTFDRLLYQQTELEFTGKTFTFSAEGLTVDIMVVAGNTSAVLQAGSGRQSVVLHPNGEGAKRVEFYANSGNGNSYTIKNVKLEEGSIATAFQQPHPQVELAKCQRHYQFNLNVSGSVVAYADGYAFAPYVTYVVAMATLPTVVITTMTALLNGVDNTVVASHVLNSNDVSGFASTIASSGITFNKNMGGYIRFSYTASTGY
ncbi:MAG: hypothetical protein HRU28_02500 [Rhizobiales bacterium]|nr:hypothetical protein [Hyphomicrobiales bacterium]